MLDPAEHFALVYAENTWGNAESKSGSGSTLSATVKLRAALPELFERLAIESVLDIPCGDFNWMRHTDLTIDGANTRCGVCDDVDRICEECEFFNDESSVKYIGADIVPEMIEANRRAYGKPGVSFEVLDLLTDQLPKCDLVICRDCLVHLPYADVMRAMENICKSGAKYVLTTTFPLHGNGPVELGGWFPINLQAEPFELIPPMLLVNEGCEEPYYWDKCMGLWRIEP